MPAKFIRTYKYTAPDGEQFDSLVEEKKHELASLLGETPQLSRDAVLNLLIENADSIVDILRQKERKHASPAKPRKRKTIQPAPEKE